MMTNMEVFVMFALVGICIFVAILMRKKQKKGVIQDGIGTDSLQCDTSMGDSDNDLRTAPEQEEQ